MARITDPRILIALRIHKGAIELFKTGKFTTEAAVASSCEMMQELFPQENVTTFRVPHWISTNT